MTKKNSPKWLLLIHQIPPRPNAFRVKIWRRLQQVGAVAIKQSVYAMPFSAEYLEDLTWILKEITTGGGEGSVLEVRFLQGLSNEQIKILFLNARKPDYEQIIQEATLLLDEWSKIAPEIPRVKGQVQVAKLQRRLDQIKKIDFFGTLLQETANSLITELFAFLSGRRQVPVAVKIQLDTLNKKIWVTRKNIFVDRIACAWLIQRFVDNKAVFKFIDPGEYAPKPGEICFDMFQGRFTHRGDLCTFEVMIRDLEVGGIALTTLAQVVHDIDLKEMKYGHPETNGFNALLAGLAVPGTSDDQRMDGGFQLFDNLYTYFQNKK